ncbi:hypothetical protein NPS53_09710 [Pseudomonas putida]|uniref:hypothetical protein n=1 Tax=Pseudomonas putida TaxID=303 RepID=UPI002364A477|nr:hypothetical protein [Pseudomonas putida]MDD2139854.1 hypothetical protein [Pseudomonas putida]HDS1721777.1 hypothetical protein [Pseudomonas putida]
MPKHEPKFHAHLGGRYLIIAEFPDTEAGADSANSYMAKHPNAGVLAVQGERVILANNTDHGAGSGAEQLSLKAKRAVANYGLGVCLEAYRLTATGDGARTIGNDLDLSTSQADAAIDAGRELAGHV